MSLLMTLMLLAQIAPAVRPSPTGVVTGQLLNTSGQPAVGVRVSAMAIAEQPGTPVSTATELVSIGLTDNEGRYRLADVPPGRYYIVAGLIELPTYYPGVREMKDAIGISIGLNTTAKIDFKMAVSDGFTVSGRIVVRDNRPLPQNLKVVMSTPGKYVSTDVTETGKFEFTHVAPGSYVFSVLAGAAFSRTDVRVVDQDNTGLELVLPPEVKVLGGSEKSRSRIF